MSRGEPSWRTHEAATADEAPATAAAFEGFARIGVQSSATEAPAFWMEGLSARGLAEPFPGGRLQADVVVVGAGLGGLSAALHLLRRRPGIRVVVLEADRLGAAAACRSTGMLTPGVGQSLPGLVRRLGPSVATQLYRETLRAVDGVAQLCAEERIDAGLHLGGQLVLAHGPAGPRRLAATAALMNQLGLPVDALDTRALATHLRLPGLHALSSPADVAHGFAAGSAEGPAALRFARAGTLHPGRLLLGLAAAVKARGGIIYEHARVTAFAGQPVEAAVTGDGVRGIVTAPALVLATDGHVAKLGVARGRIIPLHLRALVTAPLSPPVLDAIGWPHREGIIDSRRLFSYLRLTDDGRVLIGGGRPLYRGRAPQLAAALDDGFARARIAELETLFGTHGLRAARRWSGIIGYVLDGLPVIERLADRPGVVKAGGWCGHGIALSLAAGDWVAALVTNAPAPAPLAWFARPVPALPTEPARWLGVPIVTGIMQALDRRF